ncbi:MAG: hypothetical protein JWN39_4171 [Ilumatobacteraceae bacterium]|nr:hypothetical protein [Ilumatobacteraceae bacterium]
MLVGIRQAEEMSDDSMSRERWHDAAGRASFTPYEPSDSTARWAGGFGSEGNRLEVIGLVAGVEVSVDTSRPDRPLPDGLLLRNAVAELLWRYVLGGQGELKLPYTVGVIPDDRAVTVDDADYIAHGMRIDGDARWVGSILVGDLTVRITTTSPSAPSLRQCGDTSSLSESPPNGR